MAAAVPEPLEAAAGVTGVTDCPVAEVLACAVAVAGPVRLDAPAVAATEGDAPDVVPDEELGLPSAVVRF
jgi:hypothetical protein